MTLTNRFITSTPLETLTSALSNDGYVIIEGLIDESDLQRLRSELAVHVEEAHTGNESFWGYKTKRFGGLLQKSEIARQLLVHPTVLGLADVILLPYCASYWVNYTGVMHLNPGESAQVLHRDTALWPFANPSPPLTLATMWAVNDFTADNGGTLVVPGSHKWDDSQQPTATQVFPTEMPAGSVLIYTGNVIHAGGANRTTNPRFGLALHYVLGWLRQEENQVLTMTADEARELPAQIQKLIGYSLGAASLGMVNHKDPFEVLTGIKEDRPRDLSTHELDANEAKVNKLKVVATHVKGRTRISSEDLQ